MKLLIFFTLIFSAWAQQQEPTPDPLISVIRSHCTYKFTDTKNTQAVIDMYLTAFERTDGRAYYQDVENQVHNLSWSWKYYFDCTPEFYTHNGPWSKRIEAIQKKGYRGEMRSLSKAIKEEQQFRDIEPLWNEVQQYAAKLGISPNTFIRQRKLEECLANGKQAANSNKLSCTEINNGSSLGPTRNQDSTGWCYAFATADLLSHYYGQELSATDIAVNYNQQSFWRSLLQSGLADFSLTTVTELALDSGVCLEEELPASDYIFSLKYSYGPTLKELQSLLKKAHRKKIEATDLCEACQHDIAQIFPATTLEELNDIIKASRNPLDELFEYSCQEQSFPQPLPAVKDDYRGLFGENIDRVMSTIDTQLNHGKILSISYNAHFLATENYTHGSKNIFNSAPNHASTVVGRRFNEATGACDYLIRNSWGNSCSEYIEEYKDQCSNGQIWVPAYELRENLSRIIYLEEQI